MKFHTLKDFDFSSKKVIVRVGMDVPVDKEGNITNDKRILEGLPTIKYLLEHNTKQVIIINHIGRPKNSSDKNLNHNRLAEKLSSYLGQKVAKLDDCIDVKMPGERIVLLENLRFHPEETANYMDINEEFAKKLASYADIYVNDAFSVSHRDQASITGIPKFLPSCAGLLLEKEIRTMSESLNNPARPFIVLLGGAKISTKLGLIKNLLPKVDKLLLGGAMIFTFYKAKGLEVGKSLVEDSMSGEAKALLDNPKLILPVDLVIGTSFDMGSEAKTVSVDDIPKDWIGLDIGLETVEQYKKLLSSAKTIVWNGPMGLFEVDKFAVGTNEIVNFLAELKTANIVIGGGDTATAIEKINMEKKFGFISTGGGAALELLEGKILPGVVALEESKGRIK